jgi:uncharacterized protein YdaT
LEDKPGEPGVKIVPPPTVLQDLAYSLTEDGGWFVNEDKEVVPVPAKKVYDWLKRRNRAPVMSAEEEKQKEEKAAKRREMSEDKARAKREVGMTLSSRCFQQFITFRRVRHVPI